jgi:hypothetical protein
VTGDYVYTLSKAFNNIVSDSPISEIFNYQIRDSDGSLASSTMTVSVSDDAPLAKAISMGSVLEADLATGSSPDSSALKVLGNLFTDGDRYGADDGAAKGIVNLSFANVTNTTGVTAGSSSLNYVIASGDGFKAGSIGNAAIKATDSLGNSIIIDKVTGDYVYALNANFSNIVSGTSVSESFTYQLQDSDGSVDSNTLSVSIADDAPLAKALGIGSVAESSLSTGSSPDPSALKVMGNLFTNGDTYGGDGAAVKGISALSFSSATNTSGVSAGSSSVVYTILSSDGFAPGNTGHSAIKATDNFGNSIIVDQVTGDYVYTLNNAFSNTISDSPVVENFTYQLQDSDGSVASSTLSVSVADDAPVANTIAMGTLSEANLPTGSDPATYSYITYNQNIYFVDGTLSNSNRIFHVDSMTNGIATLSLVASISNTISGSQADVSPDGTKIYMVGSNNVFGYYDLTSSTYVQLPNLTLNGGAYPGTQPSQAGFAPDGTFYIGGNTSNFFKVDLTTGVLTNVGPASGIFPNDADISITQTGQFYTGESDASGTKIYLLSHIPNGTSNTGTLIYTNSLRTSGLVTLGDGTLLLSEKSPSNYFINLDPNGNVLGTYTYQYQDSPFVSSGGDLAVNLVPVVNTVPNPAFLKLSGNLFTSGDLYGADGAATKGITALSFASVINASNVSAGSSSVAYTITATDGFIASNTGHSAIKATDSLGNSIIIDEVTGDYIYTLNSAFHNTTAGSPVTESFSYSLQDSDGSVRTNTLSVNIADDVPVASSISIGPLSEASLPGGTLPSVALTYAIGNLVTAGNSYGADGMATQGVSFLTWTSATNATGVSAGVSSIPYIITATDGFSAQNVGHNAIKATDSLGNALIIDEVTNDYVYHLQAGFTRINTGDPVIETYTYQLTDSDGSTSSNTINVTIVPDTQDVAANNNIYLLDTSLTGFNRIFQVSSMTGGIANLTLIDSISDSISGPHGDVTLDGSKIYMLGLKFGYYDLSASTYTQLPALNYNGNTVTGMTQAAFAPDGQFYVGGGAGGNDFYTVNLSTGELTNVGSATIAGTSNVLDLVGGDLTITDDGLFYENSNIGGTTSVYLLEHIPDGTPNTATLVYSGANQTSGLANLSNGYLLLSDRQPTNLIELVDSSGNLVSTYNFEYQGAPFAHSGGDLASNTITVLPGSNTIPTGGFTPTAGNEILTLTLNYPIGSSLPITNSSVSESVSAANGLLGTLLTNSQPGDTYAIYSVLSYDTNATPTLTNNIAIGSTEIVGIVDSSGQLAGEGNLIVNADGSFTFTPTIMTELSGNAFIDFTIQDTTSGQISNTGIVQIQNLVQIAPVVLDLSGSGIHLSSADVSGVGVDLTGTGTFNNIGWIMNGEGILAIDPNGTGKVTNISQFSFASPSTGAQTDLQGLVIYDTNHDSNLDATDAAFSQFGLLLANGQFESLAKLGITSLSLTSDNQSQIINGNVVHGLTTYTTADGQTHLAADVSLSISSQTSTTLQDKYTSAGQLDFSKLPDHVKSDAPFSGEEKVLQPADVIQSHNQMDVPSPAVIPNSALESGHIGDHEIKSEHMSEFIVAHNAAPNVSDVAGIMASAEHEHIQHQLIAPEHQNPTGSA